MYLPRHFEETRPEVLHRILAAHPLGLLVRTGPAGLVADVLPWLVEPGPTPAGTLVGHVARANPLWRELPRGAEVLVVFQGPQAYISPNWYASKAEHGQVVPTWNYAMVQARGRIEVQDDPESVRAIVTRLTETHEATQSIPWKVSDAPPDFTEKLLRTIVGIRIPLEALVGKLKLSQNRPAADREGVRRGLQSAGEGEQLAMAEWIERVAS